MADSNEQENQTISTEEPITPPELSPKKTSSTFAINKLTLVIAIAALTLTGYNQYSGLQHNNNLERKNKELQGQVQRLQEEQKDINQELNTKTTALVSSKQELEAKISEFTKEVQALRQKGNQSQDWLLLKARYFLELAQINAHWQNTNEQSTTALLQQADLTLAQMNAAELFKVRQVIAQELQQLKTANHLDLPGLLSQFDALQTSIDKLDLQKSLSFKETNKQTPNAKPADSSWKAQLNNSLDLLGKLVVVRRDNEIKPLISPVFESLLKESLYLNIKEAQWAIINQDPMTYQLAIKQAITTLQRGFKQLNTSMLIKELEELKKINIAAEKIEVGAALPLLNELIDQRQVINPKNKLGGQKE